ncbi:hypothetical protein CISIN_1g044961mg [Citrus sinensis]|uniref:Uncharacterized protein n=1 Tax=Citrus sinensis TaxID=2711 RepID=A0A067D784_CITSI|nr:hypothetical protein CISIN_1g044961mg [Citrus sinensis]
MVVRIWSLLHGINNNCNTSWTIWIFFFRFSQAIINVIKVVCGSCRFSSCGFLPIISRTLKNITCLEDL